MAPVFHAAAPSRRIGRGLAACVLVFAFLATPATASPASRLDAAKGRLAALTERIASEEAQARSLQDHVFALSQRINDATSRVAGIDAQLATTQRELDAAAAQAKRLQARLDAVARSLFMQGAGSVQASMLEQLLGSSSIGDLGDLLSYGQAIGQSDADLATRVGNLKVVLTDNAAALRDLRSQQVQLMAQLSAERASEAKAIADQRAALSNLERTKTQIVALIARLHARIRAEALATVGTAFQGAGHITYGAWAAELMRALGTPGCRPNLIAVVAWQYSEFTQATWNPLADTLAMPGSTAFNSVGVQNYASLDQGLQAIRTTLTNGPGLGYGTIVSALAACSDPMTTARAINASAWCRGCAGGTYVVGVIPKVEANYDLYAQL
jgi:peptidoglycan hydrolase CwlO-like protein